MYFKDRPCFRKVWYLGNLLTHQRTHQCPGNYLISASFVIFDSIKNKIKEILKTMLSELQSVSWILAEFYFNRGLQRLYTGTFIILQKTINGFLCLLIVFLKSKTYQLILKDVIKLNRNLR